jgi:glycosyltransferase involved in cell wall biosynthesis
VGRHMITVCICTHNPRLPLLKRVLESIAAQKAAGAFELLVIDNASTPPLAADVLGPFDGSSIRARIVREETPGLIHARLRAIAETVGDWMLCVDDDNVLAPNYVAEGLAFVAANPNVGAFGGKLALPSHISPPSWVDPFLPYLAVRDQGESVLQGVSSSWEIWEPPAAGAFVAREVLEHFAGFVRTHPPALSLGRSPGAAASCEDSLLMHSAYQLGLATGYNPALRLEHHIHPSRFAFTNLVRLMQGYGRSHIILDALLRGPLQTPRYYRTPAHVAFTMLVASARNFFPSPMFAYARARYHLAAARAYRDLATP